MVDAQLIDISATGIRFLSEENIVAEGIAGIEVDHRLILAELRYSEPRGDKFVFGARRLHEVAKDARLDDAAGVVSEMLGAFHHHITDGEKRDSEAMALAVMEKIVERRENGEAAMAPSEPAAVPQAAAEPVTEAHIQAEADAPVEVRPVEEIVPDAKIARSEEPPPAVEIPPANVAPRAPAPHEAAPHGSNVHVELPASAPPRSIDPVVLRPVAPERVDPLDAARASAASAIAAMQLEPRSRDEVDWKTVLGIAAALVLAVILTAVFMQRRTQARSSSAHAAAHVTAAAPVDAASAPQVLPTQPAPTQPAPAQPSPLQTPPSPQAAAQHVLIRAVGPTWISISVDGHEFFKGSLQKGARREFEFSGTSTVGIAKGSNVRLTLNGTPIPVGSGQRRMRLTADGARPLN